MDMREHINDKTALAQTYAEDGAYMSAARVLRELAREVTEHAVAQEYCVFETEAEARRAASEDVEARQGLPATHVAGNMPKPASEPDTRKEMTIDMTPTWRCVLPMLIAVLEDGTNEGKRIAREELMRMADAADAYNASIKR